MIDLRFQPMTKAPPPRPGHEKYRASPFKARTGMDDLERELKILGATDVVIESGHDRLQIRNDGWPRGGSSPKHPAVCLYFQCKHGTLRYACDEFDSWESNLRAIGLWMQRQRLALDEWGIGAGGEAYRGFAALPGAQHVEFETLDQAAMFIISTAAPESSISTSMIEAVIRDPSNRYRDAARKAHPDAGGNADTMSKLNRAKDFIEKHAGVTA
jgi:hypothetical protein